ncbi:MAG: NAD(P)-binding protein [Candidatus Acidiferrales bacterium]
MSTSRRDFLRFVVAGSAAAGCPVDLKLLAAEGGMHGQANTAASAPAAEVDGDHFDVCHKVRDGGTFPKPAPSKKCEVVIVGGGVSGMSAAYFLRERDFFLIEKEPHWGGNAYREEYQGQGFATGSAFDTEGSHSAQLAHELGLTLLPVKSADPTIANGKWVYDTWGAGLDELPYPAAVRDSFKKFRADMLAIDFEKNKEMYDAKTLASITDAYAPEIRQWWDAFGPSNWGARAEDTSAYVGLSGFAEMTTLANDDIRVTLPGGNGALAAALAKWLTAKYAERMVADAAAVSVDPQKDGVNVTYVQGGQPLTVAAKYAVMATPKFFTARIVAGLPGAQSDAMMQFRMCPYPVINMIFDRPVYNKAYDTWCPGNTFTDFIVADWVLQRQPGYRQKNNILSFYTPLREAQRSRMLEVAGCRTIATHALADFQKLLPEFRDAEPVEIHFYRRGHPMFLPAPGLYTKVIPLARQPMERVFFANTDSVGPMSDISNAVLISSKAAEWVGKRAAGASAASATAAIALND